MKSILSKNMTSLKYLLFSLVSNDLKNNERRHSKHYSPTAMFRGTPCIFKTKKLNLLDHQIYGLELFERINNKIIPSKK